MIATCELCNRPDVPCRSCKESQRMICYRCQGDVDDPYCETEDDGLSPEDAAILFATGHLPEDF